MLLAVCNSFVSLSKATLVYFAIEHTISYMLSKSQFIVAHPFLSRQFYDLGR